MPLAARPVTLEGPTLVDIELHWAAGRKQQEFGWLTT